MAAPLKKVLPGESFSVGASTWNAFIEAANANRKRGDGRGNVIRRDSDTGIVLVKNTHNAVVPMYGVLGIGTTIFNAGTAGELAGFKEQVALNGVLPAATHAGKFVITLEPIGIGKLGRCLIQGVGIAKIDVTAGTPTTADIKVGSVSMLSPGGSGGAQILWLETGTGERYAVVRLGGGGATPMMMVRLDENATLYSKTIQWGNSGTATSTAVAWTYGGVECRLDTSSPDGSVVAVTGGLAFSATGAGSPALPKIYNPHEFSATTAIVGGILVDADSYPATAGDATSHRYRPLDAAGNSMAHAWTPIVWVTTSINSDGETIYVVVSPRNQHDGVCL